MISGDFMKDNFEGLISYRKDIAAKNYRDWFEPVITSNSVFITSMKNNKLLLIEQFNTNDSIFYLKEVF